MSMRNTEGSPEVTHRPTLNLKFATRRSTGSEVRSSHGVGRQTGPTKEVSDVVKQKVAHKLREEEKAKVRASGLGGDQTVWSSGGPQTWDVEEDVLAGRGDSMGIFEDSDDGSGSDEGGHRGKRGGTRRFSRGETISILLRTNARQKRMVQRFEALKKREEGIDHGAPRTQLGDSVFDQSTREDIRAKAQDPDKIRVLYKIATEKLSNDLDHKLELTRLDAARMRYEKEHSEKRAEDRKAKLQSLRDCIDILKKKFVHLEGRVTILQRKLLAFRKFAPIYEELEREFAFRSPVDLIKRLDNLTSLNEEFRIKQEEVYAGKTALDREYEQAIVSHAEHVASSGVSYEKELEELHAQRSKKEVELSSLESELASLRTDTDDYLTLYFAVLDVWNHWEKTSPLVNSDNPLEIPDTMNGVLVINAINTVCQMHVKETCQQLHHDLSVIANQLWLKYVPESDDLKGKPEQIMRHIAMDLASEIGMAVSTENEYEQWNQANQQLQFKIGRQTDEIEVLKNELEHWQEKFKYSQQKRMEMSIERQQSIARSKEQYRRKTSTRRPQTAAVRCTSSTASPRPATAASKARRPATGLPRRPGTAGGSPPRAPQGKPRPTTAAPDRRRSSGASIVSVARGQRPKTAIPR